MDTKQQRTSESLVTVIVAARDERRHIARCLESILAQTGLEGELEVLVCDGMSEDGTRGIVQEVAARDSRVRLLDNPGRIVSTGLNAGIREARGEVIVRVDAHTELDGDYVSKCLEVLRRTGADNVGGPWRAAPGERRIERAITAAFQHPFSAGGARCHDVDHEGPVDTVYLGCWRKGVFAQAGMFDEELVRNQDDEFNLRLTRMGKTVWQSPEIRCRYAARGSLGSLWRQYFQYGFWKIRVMQKHGTPASVRHVVPAVFALGLMLGPVLALAYGPLWWIYGGVCGAYVLAVAGASVQVARRHGVGLLPLLPATFATFHLAYGAGSLLGVLHFLLLRRGGSEAGAAARRLTR